MIWREERSRVGVHEGRSPGPVESFWSSASLAVLIKLWMGFSAWVRYPYISWSRDVDMLHHRDTDKKWLGAGLYGTDTVLLPFKCWKRWDPIGLVWLQWFSQWLEFLTFLGCQWYVCKWESWLLACAHPTIENKITIYVQVFCPLPILLFFLWQW